MIYCIDNVLGLQKYVSDNSIDLTVTSPPYDSLRKYKGFSWDFTNLSKELYRVTKPGGVVVWVVGDATLNGCESGTSFKQALGFMDTGFKLYDTMIYAKTNPPPKNHRRYEQGFEYMFILSKGVVKTFNPILEPCKQAGRVNRGTMRNGVSDDLALKHGYGKPYKDTKIKSNIWYYFVGKREDSGGHPAIFPQELARDHILSWSNENDLILDPFLGSGTTAVIAKQLNRNFIGFEISQSYCDIAERRLNDLR